MDPRTPTEDGRARRAGGRARACSAPADRRGAARAAVRGPAPAGLAPGRPLAVARRRGRRPRRDRPPLPEPHADGTGTSATPLVPGQVIQPIDLPGALRLAGARDLDIAIARERVCQSLAELEQARVLWLPSLYVGPNWIRHDGQVQTVQGQVQTHQQELAVPRRRRPPPVRASPARSRPAAPPRSRG